MSAAVVDCNCPCPDPAIVAVPGTSGADGAAGATGVNAYTTLTGALVIPNIAANVVANVAVSSWAAVGQVLILSDGVDWGHFRVDSVPSSTTLNLEFLGYPGDAAPAAVIGIGGTVSPSGVLATITNPLPVANGGTSAATKATAQVALGLGANLTQDFDDALAYAITNSYASITGISAAAPAAGLYKVEACVTVSYTGATFASSRLLSIRARNTTGAVTLSEKTVDTGIHTTATFPAIDYVLPVKSATLASGDVVELQIQLDTVESAGSSVVTDAWISLTPLALA